MDDQERMGGGRRIDQIVQLAAQGFTNKEISRQLGISQHTVQTYWDRLRERLGASNRTAAVFAYLRETIEQQNQELRESNDALRSAHAESREGMVALLADVQRRLAESQRGETRLDYFDRASEMAHLVVYELESADPVLHRYLSPSAHHFGVAPASLQRTEVTFYDVVYDEDLPLIYEKSLGATYVPDERYVFVYRVKMPEPRWVMDTHQAIYDAGGTFTGILGAVIDIHELVLAGIVRAEVARIVITDSPVSH